MKAHTIPRVLCPYCGHELTVSNRPYDGRLGASCHNNACTNPYKTPGQPGRFEVLSVTVDVEPYDLVNAFDMSEKLDKKPT